MSCRKFSFHSTLLRNFQNFRLNGSHFRNSTVLGLSGNYPGKFPHYPHSPPFLNIRKLRSNGKQDWLVNKIVMWQKTADESGKNKCPWPSDKQWDVMDLWAHDYLHSANSKCPSQYPSSSTAPSVDTFKGSFHFSSRYPDLCTHVSLKISWRRAEDNLSVIKATTGEI